MGSRAGGQPWQLQLTLMDVGSFAGVMGQEVLGLGAMRMTHGGQHRKGEEAGRLGRSVKSDPTGRGRAGSGSFLLTSVKTQYFP